MQRVRLAPIGHSLSAWSRLRCDRVERAASATNVPARSTP